MEQKLKSGYINHRKRKIPIVWTGQFAEHVAKEHIANSTTHPNLHIRIQQLAKSVKKWEQNKKGSKKYAGYIKDNKTDINIVVIVEISNNFAYIVTSYKKSKDEKEK